MKISDRHYLVRQAGHELSEAMSTLIKKYNLTYAEIFAILAEEIKSHAGYIIRDERNQEE